MKALIIILIVAVVALFALTILLWRMVKSNAKYTPQFSDLNSTRESLHEEIDSILERLIRLERSPKYNGDEKGVRVESKIHGYCFYKDADILKRMGNNTKDYTYLVSYPEGGSVEVVEENAILMRSNQEASA